MKKNNLNININKEDFTLNDYLYAWDFFGERPNKINLYQTIDNNLFEKFLSEFIVLEDSVFIEVFPSIDGNLINKKFFLKLNNNAFLSYTHFDSEMEESIVTNIYLIYNQNGKEFINEFLKSIYKLDESTKLENSEKNINTYSVSIGSGGFEEKSIGFLEADIKNIDLYYNDQTLKKVNKLCKSIKKNKKGLSIIHGERGTGKSSLIKYLSKKIDKKFIFIPCSMFESTIINPDFRNFLDKNPDSIIILDDSDIYFSEIYSKSNIFTNNILQLVDGLDSDYLKLNIIAILNVSNVNEIDHILMSCNNIIDIISVEELEVDKIKDLNKYLKIKNKIKKDYLLYMVKEEPVKVR